MAISMLLIWILASGLLIRGVIGLWVTTTRLSTTETLSARERSAFQRVFLNLRRSQRSRWVTCLDCLGMGGSGPRFDSAGVFERFDNECPRCRGEGGNEEMPA